MTDQIAIVNAVNRSEVHSMDQLVIESDFTDPDSRRRFETAVGGLHAAVIHTFKITGHLSLREEKCEVAAEHWGHYIEFCDEALRVLKVSREKFQHAGASDLYDLILDYRHEASVRRDENLHAAECLKNGIPEGLFETKI